jgi:hypothetical protein
MHGTVGYDLVYISTEDFKLVGYTDSYWEGCMDDRKSTSRYSFSMGSTIVSWSIKNQPIVSLFTIEAEYKATMTTTSEAVWLRRIMEDLHEQQEQTT